MRRGYNIFNNVTIIFQFNNLLIILLICPMKDPSIKTWWFVLISKGTLSELIDFKWVRGNVILLTITLKDC